MSAMVSSRVFVRLGFFLSCVFLFALKANAAVKNRVAKVITTTALFTNAADAASLGSISLTFDVARLEGEYVNPPFYTRVNLEQFRSRATGPNTSFRVEMAMGDRLALHQPSFGLAPSVSNAPRLFDVKAPAVFLWTEAHFNNKPALPGLALLKGSTTYIMTIMGMGLTHKEITARTVSITLFVNHQTHAYKGQGMAITFVGPFFSLALHDVDGLNSFLRIRESSSAAVTNPLAFKMTVYYAVDSAKGFSALNILDGDSSVALSEYTFSSNTMPDACYGITLAETEKTCTRTIMVGFYVLAKPAEYTPVTFKHWYNRYLDTDPAKLLSSPRVAGAVATGRRLLQV